MAGRQTFPYQSIRGQRVKRQDVDFPCFMGLLGQDATPGRALLDGGADSDNAEKKLPVIVGRIGGAE